MSWNLRILRETVANCRSQDDCDKFKISLDSFLKRQVITDYYAHEAQELLTNALPDEPIECIKAVMRSHFPDGEYEDAASNIRYAYFRAEAHVFSFAHSIHSMSDILAKTINYALGLNYEENRINLYALSKHALGNSPKLKAKIDVLLTSSSFMHLHAFTNEIKHHSLVKTSVPMTWDNNHEWVPLKLKAFKHKETKYPEKSLKDFVVTDRDNVMKGYYNIGIELNHNI